MASAAGPSPPVVVRLQEADAVISSWKTFSGVYKRRRSALHKKWTNLSDARRNGILTKHWLPLNMPHRHRPDLDKSALWRAPGAQKLLSPDPMEEPDTDSLMWPYFNLQTLTDPYETILQLMDSRSNLHPRMFSRLDLINPVNQRLQSHFGIHVKPSLWNASTRFADLDAQRNGGDLDSSYGDLVSVSNARIMEALKTIDSFSEQEGNRVLKVQKRIYDFLGSVCVEVLEAKPTGRGAAPHAAAASEASGETWETVEPPPSLKPTLNFEPSDPASNEALQRYLQLNHDLDPYSHPTEVDWEYLGVLASHQLRTSEDRLRGLKEDPAKFLNYLHQVREHSQSMLMFHPSGQGDPLVRKRTDLANKERCAQHLQTALSTLTDAVDTWQAIFTRIERLRDLRSEYSGPHMDLLENSDEYAANMLGIMRAGAHYKSNSVDLLRAIRCSENMRSYFRISQQTWNVEQLGPKPKNNAERDLVALASTLSNDRTKDVFREWTIFEEIYDVVRRNARVSNPYLAGIAEDLNNLSSVMLVLERVWHSTRRYDLDLDAVRDALDYARPLGRLRDLDTSDVNGALQNLVQDYLNRPLKDHYTFKQQGRITNRDREANQRALDNLAIFWDAAEVMLGTEDVGALSDTVKAVLESAQPLTVTRPARGPNTTTSAVAEEEEEEEESAAVGPSTFPTVSNDTPRFTFQERRVKEKTRPPVTLTLDLPPPAALPVAAVTYPNIQLPLQHFNTVQMLMGTSSEARPGTVPWVAVVGCLVAMGFGYSTGQGSARIFEPSAALTESQGINTPLSRHEKDPWNTNTARMWFMNRRYGLAKYGWTIDQFIL